MPTEIINTLSAVGLGGLITLLGIWITHRSKQSRIMNLINIRNQLPECSDERKSISDQISILILGRRNWPGVFLGALGIIFGVFLALRETLADSTNPNELLMMFAGAITGGSMVMIGESVKRKKPKLKRPSGNE